MQTQVDESQVAMFCQKLFHALDVLGLLPPRLGARPTEYEKYPRLLLSHIKRQNSVDTGFEEWKTKVLRSARLFREEQYEERVPELFALREWMQAHKELFVSNKPLIQHLRSSLYGRLFEYLYPRRVLIGAYIKKHQGNTEAVEHDFLAREFPSSVAGVVKKIQAAYSGNWEQVITDARAELERKAHYYRPWLAGGVFDETAPEHEHMELNQDQEDNP